MEYENAPYLQSGTIVFNDSVYAMELSKGLKSKGTVTYGKDLTFLKEGNLDQNIVLSFSTNDIEKDTISFQFNNKNSGVKNNQLSVSFSGKLIKIK